MAAAIFLPIAPLDGMSTALGYIPRYSVDGYQQLQATVLD